MKEPGEGGKFPEYSSPITEDTLVRLAFFALLASAGLFYFLRKRRDRLGEELHRLAEARTAESREAPSIQDLLRRAEEQLSLAERLLSEAGSIGLWVKADDSSDNRRRRTALREADWAVSDAYRALNAIEVASPLAEEAQAIVRLLEPLPDTIPDTMGDDRALDSTVSTINEQVRALRERIRVFAASSGASG